MNKLLEKVLRRTKRDVALASAMVGSVSAMQKLFPEIEKYTRLTIQMDNGSLFGWERRGVQGAGVWRDFLGWYHGRPQSAHYVMKSMDQGHWKWTMFRRFDIRNYAVQDGEREKENG